MKLSSLVFFVENYCLRTAKCSKVYEVARYKIGRIDYKGSE